MQNAAREPQTNGQTTVQFGHRTQNPAANRTFDKRARPLGPFDADRDLAAKAPISAARLAAEAAFGAPPFQPTPASQAQITVRRARYGVVAQQPVADAVAVAELTGKGPRVFRVEPAFAVATTAAVATASAAPTRRRRSSPDKQPGQVVHVVHLQPARPEAPAPAAPLADSLVAALARVAPVLESIQRAQSFHFIDDRFDPAWRRLSKQAEELLNEVKAIVR